MAKREVEEINAGSMADIAFLLLIFFLITTTMNLPQVHEERLPQKSDVEFLLNERNVLQIMANKNDKIGIEGEFAEMDDIQRSVKKFYQHKEGTPNMPNYVEVSRKICEDTLESLESALQAYPDAALYKIEQDAWKKRLDACIAFGSGFQTLPNTATVSIQLDNATKYETYMNVLDQIMQGLNSLRDSLSKDKFGVAFDKLNDKVEIDKQKISAIRQVYPKKIMKEKNRSVQ
jgi:biopolymer transport protein ExbD